MRRLRHAAAQLSNRAIELEAAGQLEAAESTLRDALILDSDLAEAWSNLGNVLRAKGEATDAIACYQRALELKPDFADAHANFAAALIDLEQWELAKQQAKEAQRLKPDHYQALNNEANAYMGLGDPNTAAYLYEQALAINPRYAIGHNNFGNALKELGDFVGAREHYDTAIRLKPDYAEAHYNHSELITFTWQQCEELAEIADQSNPYWLFTLAKAHDDANLRGMAWRYWSLGNGLKRASVKYDEPAALELIERVKRTFTPELFERFKGSGDPSTRPIFIVGFPRCGSTLVEQILCSHPQIHGGGELTILDDLTAESAIAMGQVWPEVTAGDSAEGLKILGRLYSARTSRIAATQKPFTTDKLLGNFLRVGLIKLILPNAKIIQVSRNPLDTCLSCYQHLFSRGVLFSYDLGELGRYYRAYESLMEHWGAMLPHHIYKLRYEELVADPMQEIGGLLAYLGLDSDPACFDFWKNSRPVRTASNVQVRQPLFKSSVGKRKRYEFGLGPLKEALGM